MHRRHRGNFRVFDPLAFLADEVDPLLCSRCGGTMKVISAIDQEVVIYRILAHLHLLPPGE